MINDRSAESTISLRPRLKKISEYILNIAKDKNRIGTLRVTDVGTDHAKLPIYLIENNICGFVYATDIKPEPLQRANDNIRSSGLTEKEIKLVLCDGLNDPSMDYDCVVIAGMGGMNIIDILKQAPFKSVPYILNPMTSQNDLRGWLYDKGYDIIKEEVVLSNRKKYNVMEAVFTGIGREHQVWEKYYSSDLRRRYTEDEITNGYFQDLKRKMKKIVTCRKDSNQTDEEYEEAVMVLDDLIKLTEG